MKTLKITTAVKMIAASFLITTAAVAQTGKVWVKVTDEQGMNSVEVKNTLKAFNISSVKQAFPASHNKENLKVVEMTCNCDVNDLMVILSNQTKVFAQPEVAPEFVTLGLPNDYNMAFANDYALNLINASAAWDITKGDTNVVIAITDANYNLGHEELVGKYTFVSENYSSDYTHGTAAAITAAGNTDNGMGKSSIGYNSRLQLRVMDYNELLSATYSGAKVINMSWASGCYYNYYAQEIINEVYANGSTMIAAAGNGGTCGGPDNLVYPAAFDHVIAVSSVGPFDNHERYVGNPASTHQHNSSVDICAPGYDVALSTSPGSYVTGNGTSFAAPYVSGTVALMYAVNPCLTPDNIELILKATAVNIDAVNPAYVGKLGAGRMDAGQAVNMAAKFSTMIVTGTVNVECSTMEQSILLNTNYDGTAPFTITWDNGASVKQLNNVSEGNYVATIHDSKGCLATYSAYVTALEPMNVNAEMTPALCNGAQNGTLNALVDGGNGIYTYAWENGATTAGLEGLKEGFYDVMVTDGNGCTVLNTFHVAEPTALIATIAHIDQLYVNHANVDVTVAGGTAPYSYTWNNGAATQDLNEVDGGFYEVLITDANGCQVSANAIVDAHEAAEVGQVNIAPELSVEDQNTTQYALGVNEVATTELNVYPNPATENATVAWNGEEVQKVILMTIAGQQIQTIDAINLQKVELTGVAQGEYFVKLYTANGQELVRKVIFM